MAAQSEVFDQSFIHDDKCEVPAYSEFAVEDLTPTTSRKNGRYDKATKYVRVARAQYWMLIFFILSPGWFFPIWCSAPVYITQPKVQSEFLGIFLLQIPLNTKIDLYTSPNTGKFSHIPKDKHTFIEIMDFALSPKPTYTNRRSSTRLISGQMALQMLCRSRAYLSTKKLNFCWNLPLTCILANITWWTTQLAAHSGLTKYLLISLSSLLLHQSHTSVRCDDHWAFGTLFTRIFSELALESLYWMHVEYFPMHLDCIQSACIITELVSVFSHGQIGKQILSFWCFHWKLTLWPDRMTSTNSTFPYSVDECIKFIRILKDVEGAYHRYIPSLAF